MTIPQRTRATRFTAGGFNRQTSEGNAESGNATNNANLDCLIVVRSFNGASQLFSSSHVTTGTFTGPISFTATIPTSVVGYVTTTCSLPEPGAADSRLVGFTIQ